jgi:hypothetical protein
MFLIFTLVVDIFDTCLMNNSPPSQEDQVTYTDPDYSIRYGPTPVTYMPTYLYDDSQHSSAAATTAIDHTCQSKHTATRQDNQDGSEDDEDDDDDSLTQIPTQFHNWM